MKKEGNNVLETRQRVSTDQKAWKFIRDVNNTSISCLGKTAVVDGARTYTYGLMFREWERYASVFSALGMTGENQSRVGLLGSTSSEAVFAFYGLNMVGAGVSLVPAYSALFPSKILETIRTEKLTDFIITDDFAQANLINDLLIQRKELGLQNVIVLHVPASGVTMDRMLTAVQESKYQYLKGLYGPICMEELLKAYGNHPISYAPEDSNNTAFILHTSGTTGGAGKPVALSDRAFNEAAAAFYKMDELNLPLDDLVTAVIVDLSNAYGIIDQIHLPFAMGASVAVTPGGVLNPWFYKAIPACRITFMFTISAMFERWMKMPKAKDLDFSSLRFVVLGGASVSAEDKRRYYDFMQAHGAGDITLLNGYGISELGGACCLSSADLNDESIGCPLPGVKVRLLCEESGEFLTSRDAPCEGVMYLTSPAVATPELDGMTIMKAEIVEGEPYICTNDLVRMEEDGKLTFLGRANRYFLHDEGRKYESGRVETEISRQSGIESCCIVPVYVKTTHDNIPMLCVKTLEGNEDSTDVVRRALRQVFITEKTLKPDQIPCRVLLAKELPRNGNGKIDLYKISRGDVEGETFTVETVRVLERITDFRLHSYDNGPADMIQEVFDGISAELKSNMPFNKNKSKDKKGDESAMKTPKKAFETFNSMNRMGMQMMKNMMSKMGQTNPMQSFCGTSGIHMPDMKKMMETMQHMNQTAVGKMQGMMPDVQGMTSDTAKKMMPVMQDQMGQMMNCMEEMNKIALDTMQKVFDQNCKMMNQFFDSVQKMNGAMAKEEAPEKTAAEESIKKEPVAEKPAGKKPAAKKNAEKKPAEKKSAATRKSPASARSKKTVNTATTEAPVEEKTEA